MIYDDAELAQRFASGRRAVDTLRALSGDAGFWELHVGGGKSATGRGTGIAGRIRPGAGGPGGNVS